MIANQLFRVIEKTAPLFLQEKYDNAGLLVGDSSQEVKKALLSLDVTEEVVKEALKIGADVIISHHPLIFVPLKNITYSNDIQRAVALAIKNDILIYSAHTNLDSVTDGVSFKMGEKIALQDMELLVPSTERGVGYGVVGNLSEEIDLERFLLLVKKVFGVSMLRYTKLDRPIKKVALCGGSGSSFIKNAIKAEADVYVSADFKYHDFFIAENHLSMVDIGHFESEQFTLEIFYDVISKKFPNFAIQISSVNSNPIKYL